MDPLGEREAHLARRRGGHRGNEPIATYFTHDADPNAPRGALEAFFWKPQIGRHIEEIQTPRADPVRFGPAQRDKPKVQRLRLAALGPIGWWRYGSRA